MDIYDKYTQEQIEEMHDEMLDDVYPVFKIGSAEFYASQILANCNPILYNISVSEYADFLQEQENEE